MYFEMCMSFLDFLHIIIMSMRFVFLLVGRRGGGGLESWQAKDTLTGMCDGNPGECSNEKQKNKKKEKKISKAVKCQVSAKPSNDDSV